MSTFVGVHVQPAAQLCPSRPQLGQRNRPGEIQCPESTIMRASEHSAYAHRPNNRALSGPSWARREATGVPNRSQWCLGAGATPGRKRRAPGGGVVGRERV